MSEEHEFDQGIAVRELETGRYAADMGAGWVVGGGVNGGYVLAVLANAVAHASPVHHDPLVLSAHYLTATRPGSAEISTELVRQGRGSTTMAATLSQDGVGRITALATYGDLGTLSDDVRTTAPEPDLSPREQCVANQGPPPGMGEIPLLERSEMLLDPAALRPSGTADLAAWFRFADGRDLDPLALLFAVDALPPVTFALGTYGWAPTVSLTVHVRARPAPGWVRLRHASHNIAGGYFEEDAEVWDSSGRLVAQSRQLALLPRP